jgi:transcriptional regulator with XRE-family HTH domain
MNVGKRITLFRESKEMNLQDLSDKAGIGRSTLSEIENGTNTPNLTTLQKLADALDTTVGELVDGKLATGVIHGLLPDDVKEFLDSQDALSYLKINAKAQELGVSPEHIAQYVESFRMVQTEQKKRR